MDEAPYTLDHAGLRARLVPGGSVLRWLLLRRATLLRCDGRTIAWTLRHGPFTRTRERSLLDLQEVFERDGFLVLDPRPGPLPQEWIDARGLHPAVVATIAGYLDEAIQGAERRRGEAPDRQAFAVQRLIDRD